MSQDDQAEPEGGRPLAEEGEELSQERQLAYLSETGDQSLQAAEEDEEDVLRELYGEPDENGIYQGEGA